MLVALVIIRSLIYGFAGRMQIATLFIGKIISTDEVRTGLSNGFQDALTTKGQNIKNALMIPTYVLCIIYGFYIKWPYGLAVLLLSPFLTAACQSLMPSKVIYYLKYLLIFISNQEADFVKNDDFLRAEAAGYVRFQLTELLNHYKENDVNAKLPTMTEANSM